uniref:F-box/kelch-repeat protein SKIP11 n=1 Tax=Anthurium amnicola TaxID=1678845 RepID=A0A1D1YS73_9ARAE
MLEGQPCLISRALPSSCEQDSKWVYMHYHLLEISNNGKRPLDEVVTGDPDGDEDDGSRKKLAKHVNYPDHVAVQEEPSEDCDRQSGDGEQYDPNSLIQALGRDISINCFIRCSRSDYGTIASLNQSFHSLIRTGELYKLRRQNEIIEHWVYFSCNVLEWEAFDPHRCRWMHLPRMPLPNECFMCSDKESLAVGTELLVFGMEVSSHVVLRYSILTNSWSPGVEMNSPRCLFGSASLGEIAIVAGGCNAQGVIYDSAELYNSETQEWITLPSMQNPRKMCSGVFMDKKFYVIGGVNTDGPLTCGEEFDLKTGNWRVITNMFPAQNGATGAPPLVAVVNNELYAADYAEKVVRKYDKKNNQWTTLGSLPERSVSMNGWGLAFRACGERLIVIGGPRVMNGGTIDLNSWVPGEGPPEWDLIARKPSGGFVYNCAVMGC